MILMIANPIGPHETAEQLRERHSAREQREKENNDLMAERYERMAKALRAGKVAEFKKLRRKDVLALCIFTALFTAMGMVFLISVLVPH